MNGPTQNSETPLNQNVVVSRKSYSKNLVLIFTITFVFSIGVLGGYFLGVNKKLDIDQKQRVQPTPEIEPNITTPTSFPSERLSPVSITGWETRTFEIKHESFFAGEQILNIGVKIPQNWKIEVNQKDIEKDFLITNCSVYTLSSEDQYLKLTLEPICTAWSSELSDWPINSVVVLEQVRDSHRGSDVSYRVRFSESDRVYSYVDGSKTQLMDAIAVGYAPPNESNLDFIFIPAYLYATYSGPETQRDYFLGIADQIAASITLQ